MVGVEMILERILEEVKMALSLLEQIRLNLCQANRERNTNQNSRSIFVCNTVHTTAPNHGPIVECATNSLSWGPIQL